MKVVLLAILAIAFTEAVIIHVVEHALTDTVKHQVFF